MTSKAYDYETEKQEARADIGMSGQLRPLTTAQKQWALTHTIDNYALKFKKGKAVCLICGHEWEAEEGMCRCPHCGAKVEVKATTQRVVRRGHTSTSSPQSRVFK